MTQETETDRLPAQAADTAGGGWRLMRDAVRLAALRPVAPATLTPATLTPAQGLALFALASACGLGLERLAVPGPAQFDLQGWLAAWSLTALGVAALGLLAPSPRQALLLRLPAWLVLWMLASLLPQAAQTGLSQLQAGDVGSRLLADIGVPPQAEPWLLWGVMLLPLLWWLLLTLQSARAMGLTRWRPWAFVAVLAGAVALSNVHGSTRAWYPDPDAMAQPQREELVLDQELFEHQLDLAHRQFEALAQQRPQRHDVYGLVYAPYAAEDVFLRESRLVESVLAERFDARGRVLALVNHAATARERLWATPLNLQRALQAIARRMDPEQDLLVLYLTSHGGQDFRLASAHGPLHVAPLTPQRLREMLDASGIRHRVIAISACHSGGWIGPLADERTLVMTAAHADKTSYGCGHRSPLTFFGRALFDEALRQTHSFEDAFARAVPVIAQREREARKPDGFSDPQISVGSAIRPLLRALEQQLAEPAPVAPDGGGAR